mmetsp:Transcript_23909/g.73659  ORF Transcript_23909/g.73659 Transcript_23909/m.73659 type:complete len:228 (-) Transcript_23909:775-1458(-)
MMLFAPFSLLAQGAYNTQRKQSSTTGVGSRRGVVVEVVVGRGGGRGDGLLLLELLEFEARGALLALFFVGQRLGARHGDLGGGGGLLLVLLVLLGLGDGLLLGLVVLLEALELGAQRGGLGLLGRAALVRRLLGLLRRRRRRLRRRRAFRRRCCRSLSAALLRWRLRRRRRLGGPRALALLRLGLRRLLRYLRRRLSRHHARRGLRFLLRLLLGRRRRHSRGRRGGR